MRILLSALIAVVFILGCSFSKSSSDSGGGSSSGLHITTASLPNATEGQSYSVTIKASGGTTPYTWSWNNLPGWLSAQQSGNDLVLSGTPPQGTNGSTYNGIQIGVVDSSTPTQSDSKTYSLTVGSGGGGGSGIDPSGGSGGPAGPGQTYDYTISAGSGHVYIYIPTSYDPQNAASPVIWLFNEEIFQWKAIADANNIILVDLDQYNETQAYVDKINEVCPWLEQNYNVDKARYYFAGWSAGGNIAIMLTDANQTFVAAAMVFPGSGGAAPAKPAGRPNGAKYYYAVGDQDTSTGYYPGCINEANYRAQQGYTTKCDVVQGCGHYIDESKYHKRQDAWNWVKDFNLTN